MVPVCEPSDCSRHDYEYFEFVGVPSAKAKGRKCSFWGKLRLVKSLLLEGIKSTNCVTWNYSCKGEFLSFRDSNSEVYAEERWMISILIN